MQVIVTAIRGQTNEDGKAEIVLTTDQRKIDISELKGVIEKRKALIVDIKQYRQRRSLDANAYLWVLAHQIAEVLRSTKEDIYRRAIKEVGQFEILPIKNEAVERWLEVWKGKGIGWFAEVMEESKLPGYTKVISYYGSSCYDTKEMSVLIDHLITDAKEAGIDVITEDEKNLLLQEWGI